MIDDLPHEDEEGAMEKAPLLQTLDPVMRLHEVDDVFDTDVIRPGKRLVRVVVFGDERGARLVWRLT